MRKYSNYYLYLCMMVFLTFGMMLLGLGMDIYPVFGIFGALFIFMVVIWSSVRKDEKYTKDYQKKEITDRLYAKYSPMSDAEAHAWIDKCASEDSATDEKGFVIDSRMAHDILFEKNLIPKNLTFHVKRWIESSSDDDIKAVATLAGFVRI